MSQNNFTPFRFVGNYLISNLVNESTTESDQEKVNDLERSDQETAVGYYRVSFNYAPCSEATVIAQAIMSPESMTFRKWNPFKLSLPYGLDTGVSTKDNYCKNVFVCFLCMFADWILNFEFEEVMDCCQDGKIDAETYFVKCDAQISRFGTWFRPCLIVL